jgi:hypothetical protein
LKRKLKAATRREIRKRILEGKFFSDRYFEELSKEFRLVVSTVRATVTIAGYSLTAEDLGVRSANIKKGEATGTITAEETAARQLATRRLIGGFRRGPAAA